MWPRSNATKPGDQHIGGLSDHPRVIFVQGEPQQLIMVGRLLTTRQIQPFSVGIQRFGQDWSPVGLVGCSVGKMTAFFNIT